MKLSEHELDPVVTCTRGRGGLHGFRCLIGGRELAEGAEPWAVEPAQDYHDAVLRCAQDFLNDACRWEGPPPGP